MTYHLTSSSTGTRHSAATIHCFSVSIIDINILSASSKKKANDYEKIDGIFLIFFIHAWLSMLSEKTRPTAMNPELVMDDVDTNS